MSCALTQMAGTPVWGWKSVSRAARRRMRCAAPRDCVPNIASAVASVANNSRNRCAAWYSTLDGEWPERKRNFERWLAPENFDSEGLQRASLAALNVQKA